MQCSKADRLLQLYIDKQLTFEQIRTLESHLSSCPSCRRNLFVLEEIDLALKEVEMVVEPADLTVNIMRRVAQSTQQAQAAQVVAARQAEEKSFNLFRPSLPELLTILLLATIAMLGVLVEQPVISVFLTNFWYSLNDQTLMLYFWVIGTMLGIWITLAVAGSDMRSHWYRAVMDRLPVRP